MARMRDQPPFVVRVPADVLDAFRPPGPKTPKPQPKEQAA